MTMPFNKFTLQKLQETKPKKSAVVPNEGDIIKIMDLSFTREQAIKALKMTDNNIKQAVDWIFDHPGDINQETPSGSQVDLHFSLTSDSEDEYDMICKKPLFEMWLQTGIL